ncbi:hypothetical protein HG531_000868 [Fusarium graminearum]|nr:hypothetical protein HG531_000868 [Fusarium graminearum]
MVCSVLGLRLEPKQSSKNKNFSSNKQEHDLSAPVQLIGVDEVWEHGGQHKSCKLLAHKTESNGLGTGGLRSSLLSDGPAEATDGGSVQHRPCDHECEKSSIGGMVGCTSHRGSGDDDRPAAKECTASNKRLSSRKDIGYGNGNAVGEELEGRRNGSETEGIGLTDELEVVGLDGQAGGKDKGERGSQGQSNSSPKNSLSANPICELSSEESSKDLTDGASSVPKGLP